MSYTSAPHFLTHEKLIFESSATHDRLQRYTQAIGSTHNFRQVRRDPYKSIMIIQLDWISNVCLFGAIDHAI